MLVARFCDYYIKILHLNETDFDSQWILKDTLKGLLLFYGYRTEIEAKTLY